MGKIFGSEHHLAATFKIMFEKLYLGTFEKIVMLDRKIFDKPQPTPLLYEPALSKTERQRYHFAKQIENTMSLNIFKSCCEKKRNLADMVEVGDIVNIESMGHPHKV